MRRSPAPLLVLALLAAGCAAEEDGFSWGDADTLASAPETEEELTAALLAAVFAAPIEEEAEYASLLDLLLDAAIPSAQADDQVADSCAPSDDPPWVTMTPNGPSGTFGAAQNAVTLDTDQDYCQDSAGNWNSGNSLYKHFSLGGVTATCNWGGEYDVSSVGVSRRVGQSSNKDISATFTFEGDETGSADCSVLATSPGEDEMHLGGVCSGWSAGFSATPGTACTLELKRGGP